MFITGNTLTLILATGADPRLRPLTADRAKAAVPFGGNYRLIDFALTNCLHSGLRRILVLTQYHSHSLQKHLRDGWSIFNPELKEFITPVPPQMRNQHYGYANAADALRQNLYLLERSSAEYICVVSGEHVYRMDYAALLDFHADQDADATIACIDGNGANSVGDPGQSLVYATAEGKVASVGPGSGSLSESIVGTTAMRGIDVYAFKKSVLSRYLKDLSPPTAAGQDLASTLLPGLLADGNSVMTYRFGGAAGRVSCDRYWRTIDTLDDYYRANMDLLKTEAGMDLYQRDWPIRTYQAQHPPARTVPGRSSNEGIFVNSMVANGTVIAGGGVNHSVLFPSVFVDDAATVEDSILLSGVRVGENARLYNCIVDKNVSIPAGAQIGYDAAADARKYVVTERGTVVVGKASATD